MQHDYACGLINGEVNKVSGLRIYQRLAIFCFLKGHLVADKFLFAYGSPMVMLWRPEILS